MGAYESICAEVDRLKLSCPDPDTLEATFKTAPLGGGTVILSNRQDSPRAALVNKQGRAAAR